MKLEKNIDRIKMLSRQKDEENLGFRSFLKSSEIPGRKIDFIVQRLNNLVSSQIDCQSCANCCREIKPLVKERDIINMATALNMSTDTFKKQYLVNAEDKEGYHFNVTPCSFLEDNHCRIYNSRPDDCRSYPHLHKNNFLSRSISVIHNCFICPIVFNVYDLLKNEIWAMDEFDDFF